MPRWRRSVLSVLIVALSTVGCSGDDAPDTLFDGSPAASLPVELQGLEEPTVLTRLQRVAVDAVEEGSLFQSCIRVFESDGQPESPLLGRVGVHTETVTFRDVSGNWLAGCDNSSGPREDNRRWCGWAYGRLYGERLRDPRIDIGCRTAAGDEVGFAWVYPGTGARYVVVDQPGYAEVYEVDLNLPIRIATTSGVIVERSRARFDVSEHDVAGKLIRRYELDAPVAG